MNSRLRRQRREVVEMKHGDWPGGQPNGWWQLLAAQTNPAELQNQLNQLTPNKAAEQIKEQR